MDLILWRHAQAEDPRPGLDDLDRQLTAKGRTQARLMAQWLKQHMPATTRVISSPALRACQTADALHLPYEIINTISPDAAVEALLQATQWPLASSVLLVGHQPVLGELASVLVAGRAMSWSISKGAIWWITGTKNQADLRVVLSPKFL